MKLIELHILQSFPVSCMNRDDVGAPKTAVFGGANRARISSQCLKRAIRLNAAELKSEYYSAKRSRIFIADVAKLLVESMPDQADALARCAAHHLGRLDPKDSTKVKTLIFLSPEEYRRLAKLLIALPAKDREDLCEALANFSAEELDQADADAEGDAEEPEGPRVSRKGKGADKRLTAKQFNKKVDSVMKSAIAKEFGKGFVKDAADIAIFGRMAANDPSLTLEGAGMFSHALSTHRAENDIDFFSAVDDRPVPGEAGAGMTGTLEFTSATYYRYVGLNLGLLADADHLGALSPKERESVVDAFLRAAILAVPGARKNSMNAHTVPGYVLGLVKDKGQPLQLINAFEKPLSSRGGFMDDSILALKKHHDSLKKTWGIEPVKEVAIPDKTLEEFCKEIVAHVG